MLVPTLLLQQAPGPQAPSGPSASATIESLLATHARLTKFEAKVVRKGAPEATLARDGERVLLRVAQPTGNLLPTVQTIMAAPNKAWAYDATLNEILPLKPQGKSPAERLTAALGGRDDALTFLLDPVALAGYLRPLEKLSGWTAAPGSLSLRSNGARTTIGYDPATRRIVRIASTSGGSAGPEGKVAPGFDLRFSYEDTGLARFAPTGARQVAAFTDLSRSIEAADAAAMAVISRLIRKNARLVQADVTVATDGAEYRVRASGDRVRQTGPKLDLGYDGATLTVLDRSSGKAYRGRARRADVRRIAVKLGEPLVPIAASFLGHGLPFANLFFPARRATLGGRIGDGAQAADILTLKTAGTRETVFVRSDGLVMSLEAEIKEDGGTVALSRQRFVYRDPEWLEKGAGSLSLPAATGTVQPLPKVERPKSR